MNISSTGSAWGLVPALPGDQPLGGHLLGLRHRGDLHLYPILFCTVLYYTVMYCTVGDLHHLQPPRPPALHTPGL